MAVIEGSATVQNRDCKNVSELYLRGAKISLETALKHNITMAILKDGSPSCGSNKIYDGTFGGKKIPGMGVTTAMFRSHGINVFSENQIDEIE